MNCQIGEIYEYVSVGGKKGTTLSLASRILYNETVLIEEPEIIREAFLRCELLLQAEYPVSQLGNTLLQADDRLIAWIKNEKVFRFILFLKWEKLIRTGFVYLG